MKNHKVLIAVVLLLSAITAGMLYAQSKEMTKPEKVVKVEKTETCPMGGSCGMNMGAGSAAPMPDMPDMPGMTPNLPPDIEKKVIDQQIKFVKATATLRADLEQKQLEMKQLWLDSEPSADKIVAKMNEIDKVEVQIKEQGIRNRLAVYGLLPKDARKGFLRGCCGGGMGSGMGMMGGGMGMCGGMCGGMGMGPGMMGTGPQVRIEKRIIKKGADEGENEKEE